MEVTKASLRQRFSSMETDELVALHDDGSRSDDAMDVIESILTDRGVSYSTRNEIVDRLADEQKKLTDSYARIGTRLAAQVIDTILVLVIAIPLAMFVGPLTGLAVFIIYLLFQDGLPKGQSLGKRLLKIAVVDKSTGKKCTFWKSFVRNIILAVLGIFDWVFIFTESRQRLGDKAASTIVITQQSRSV